MKKFVLLPLVLLLTGCGMQQLKEENAAMKSELEVTRAANQALFEIGVMLDSIDINRENLDVRLEEGTTYNDYIQRVKDLGSYAESTERKLDEIEEMLKNANQSNSTLAASITKLRRELTDKNKYITFLESQMTSMSVQKDSLVTITQVQKDQITDMDQEIQQKTEELKLIEERVTELMVQAQVNEADSYFTRAKAIELAADRTKLAPRKKKSTYKEALNLYMKALEAGKEEARPKIIELQEKVN
jgi:chromosome segregation ATPase